jgi:predicted metal-dependent TIM-barrel fold hydrolase
MISRTTDDYERMAQAGCVALTEPAFWAGFDRSSPQGFFDYFRHLTEVEPKRAAAHGISHYTWICINPKEAEDAVFAREVIAIIPQFLDKPNVLGIGEIGLTTSPGCRSRCSSCAPVTCTRWMARTSRRSSKAS